MLTFDEAEHRYFWHGKYVPNVTRVLGPLTDLSMIDPEKLEAARIEGVEMHKLVELYSKDDLDEDDLPEWIVPRLAAYKKFVADNGFKVLASEERMFHPTMGFAGTTDLIGTLELPVGRKTVATMACVDLKRSFFGGRVIGLQLAAYSMLWEAMHPGMEYRIKLRYALRLLADGTYRLMPFTDATDRTVFQAALTMHKWLVQ